MKDVTKNSLYYTSLGRRKRSHAVVQLKKGTGLTYINGKIREEVQLFNTPLDLVGENGKWDIVAFVRGGGITGQTESIRLGVARALILINQDFKTTLRKAGYVTRDAREKERKKPGLKRARRAPQWSKR
ncbi:30S ribosomal protein S9 [Candidatus Berkelbacteria bacterium CG06_land_8_20_14_3_00_43_10]|uniref:30S ribosomal protein S9 n=1 Tax=Candidatus Berkelbacteria bacterium CG10_big_fil_rev_8_21_14_0_10_43_14 TaxID=1974515 RepID=A0A2M6R8V0_9BACT|nr:MAG: 30S ribosomal protein S9 [Candidatus Berkelbacteria bacterium CG2_30_43_20]PIS06936.1 MAG: 30S ribosomal protein S9 [Candidatus Berkelbacteria bacterium CG10_big_fil_rev_8_21_14_0_10_43_14]PIU87383.1 MAG: 30S ribosomal protein S9 [Candidatus Berkelbacteria bacterium CG06_land_8_20_14_3_00_43_10]